MSLQTRRATTAVWLRCEVCQEVLVLLNPPTQPGSDEVDYDRAAGHVLLHIRYGCRATR